MKQRGIYGDGRPPSLLSKPWLYLGCQKIGQYLICKPSRFPQVRTSFFSQVFPENADK